MMIFGGERTGAVCRDRFAAPSSFNVRDGSLWPAHDPRPVPVARRLHALRIEPQPFDDGSNLFQVQGRPQRVVEHFLLVRVGLPSISAHQMPHAGIVGRPQQIADENQPAWPGQRAPPRQAPTAARGYGARCCWSSRPRSDRRGKPAAWRRSAPVQSGWPGLMLYIAATDFQHVLGQVDSQN